MRALHILVVGDDDNMLALWGRRLRHHRLTLARDGKEAFARLSDDVDVLLTDLDLPALDGLGLLRLVAVSRPRVLRLLCTASVTQCADVAVATGLAARWFDKSSGLGAVVSMIDEFAQTDVRARERAAAGQSCEEAP